MATKIKDALFIGDGEASQDAEFIELNKIGYIINCSGRQLPNLWAAHGLRYLTFSWEDDSGFALFDMSGVVLEQIVDFVDEAFREGESVLIHSLRGTSRCISAVMAYFMAKYHWGVEKTYEFIASKRPDAAPNQGFMQQLALLDKRLQLRRAAERAPPTAQAQTTSVARARLLDWDGVGLNDRPGSMALEDDELVLVNSFLNAQPRIDALPPPAFNQPLKPADRVNWRDGEKTKPGTSGRLSEAPLHSSNTHATPKRGILRRSRYADPSAAYSASCVVAPAAASAKHSLPPPADAKGFSSTKLPQAKGQPAAHHAAPSGLHVAPDKSGGGAAAALGEDGWGSPEKRLNSMVQQVEENGYLSPPRQMPLGAEPAEKAASERSSRVGNGGGRVRDSIVVARSRGGGGGGGPAPGSHAALAAASDAARASALQIQIAATKSGAGSGGPPANWTAMPAVSGSATAVIRAQRGGAGASPASSPASSAALDLHAAIAAASEDHGGHAPRPSSAPDRRGKSSRSSDRAARQAANGMSLDYLLVSGNSPSAHGPSGSSRQQQKWKAQQASHMQRPVSAGGAPGPPPHGNRWAAGNLGNTGPINAGGPGAQPRARPRSQGGVPSSRAARESRQRGARPSSAGGVPSSGGGGGGSLLSSTLPTPSGVSPFTGHPGHPHHQYYGSGGPGAPSSGGGYPNTQQYYGANTAANPMHAHSQRTGGVRQRPGTPAKSRHSRGTGAGGGLPPSSARYGATAQDVYSSDQGVPAPRRTQSARKRQGAYRAPSQTRWR